MKNNPGYDPNTYNGIYRNEDGRNIDGNFNAQYVIDDGKDDLPPPVAPRAFGPVRPPLSKVFLPFLRDEKKLTRPNLAILNLAQIKEIAKSIGVPPSGSKDVLIERITSYVARKKDSK